MKNKYVLISVFLMLSALISLSISNPVSAKDKAVILRLVIPTPAGDWPQTYRDEQMAERFNERAKGEYKINVITGGAVAKLPEYFDAVRVGLVEMEFSNWGTFSFLDPRMGLMEIPFLFTTNKATSAATKPMLELYDPILQEKFNAKGLAMTNTGGLGLWSQKPIKKLEDLKGLMISSVSPPASVMIKELGSSPVTMPFTDMYESLQKKIVDAATLNAHAGIVFSFPYVCKYFTAFYGIPSPAGYSINLDVWKKMPPHIQKILLEETQKAADWMNNIISSELVTKDLASFKEKGVSIYYLPKDERERWAKQLEPYKEKQLSGFGELGVKLKKLADTVNKKYPYKADKNAM